jgi:maltose O-acetyltransferase
MTSSLAMLSQLSKRRSTVEQTQKQKMLAGQLYHAGDPEIQADQESAKAWMVRYNAALGATADERRELLRERLAAVGDGAVPAVPLRLWL